MIRIRSAVVFIKPVIVYNVHQSEDLLTRIINRVLN